MPRKRGAGTQCDICHVVQKKNHKTESKEEVLKLAQEHPDKWADEVGEHEEFLTGSVLVGRLQDLCKTLVIVAAIRQHL